MLGPVGCLDSGALLVFSCIATFFHPAQRLILFRGNVDLTVSLPFFGSTQLEVLCVITSALLLAAHCITVFNVSERVLHSSNAGYSSGLCLFFCRLTHRRSKLKSNIFEIIKDIWRNFLWLPNSIKQIVGIAVPNAK